MNLPLLESAVSTSMQIFAGQLVYPGIFDRSASLLTRTARNHPFLDGNKRTALNLALYYLRVEGIRVAPPSAIEGEELVTRAVDPTIPIEVAIDTVSRKLQAWSV
ncbi:type II toxin-antitoxin system death-on-curing family toxin [Corynebacterium sp. TA-R-1]|uniref:Type II toxin-antitoxin system death-on-curing family toxin n=1 Tax=Corynebacterium stercoris TaxID=2943490 RepID=A0ABT1G3U6_9CORY|nr:type II toxin-antitoxin system death-on-curing family toxin [Corynebacterium stercoris]